MAAARDPAGHLEAVDRAASVEGLLVRVAAPLAEARLPVAGRLAGAEAPAVVPSAAAGALEGRPAAGRLAAVEAIVLAADHSAAVAVEASAAAAVGGDNSGRKREKS